LGNITDLEVQHKGQKCGFLQFSGNQNGTNRRVLSITGDLSEAARNLFKMMRELDGMDVDIILAEKAPDRGLGRAINDRLLRASSK
jgi:L-threonylcarbamoyladenylate synthase